MAMDFQTTIAWLAGSMVVTLVSILGDRARRRSPLAWHALLPWNALAFAAVAAGLFAAAHLLALARAG